MWAVGDLPVAPKIPTPTIGCHLGLLPASSLKIIRVTDISLLSVFLQSLPYRAYNAVIPGRAGHFDRITARIIKAVSFDFYVRHRGRVFISRWTTIRR